MTICKNKKTGEVVNDFQDKPLPGTLIRNAVKAGLGKEVDFEEVEVSETEFISLKESVLASAKLQTESESQQRHNKKEQVRNKVIASLGITRTELDLLFER